MGEIPGLKNRFSADFKMASTEGLVKLLKHKKLDPQKFLVELIAQAESGDITTHQNKLLHDAALKILEE